MATKKKTSSKKQAPSTASSPVSKASTKPFVTKRKAFIIIGLLVLVFLLYYFRGLFIAATVNGKPVYRLSLTQELESKAGKTTLEGLVTQNLILQEMQKRNITVSDQEIDAEMKKIETAVKAQGRTLEEALATIGETPKTYPKRAKIEKMIQKLFLKDIVVGDKEIDTYITENKDSLIEATDEAQLKASVKDQLTQQKLLEKFQAWLTNLQKNAKVEYFVKF